MGSKHELQQDEAGTVRLETGHIWLHMGVVLVNVGDEIDTKLPRKERVTFVSKGADSISRAKQILTSIPARAREAYNHSQDGHIAQDGKYEDLLQAGTELNASRTKSIEATLRV
ncbi:uncharacterized protein LOC125526958 isoform X2 [Triticum urartu]|uniref:uncharacterized protein LOC125526958 isoform X2 n=1 Tax=Triticum urartu TaxID=4572 RepID=UPI002043F32B|nr:uncharacterized protein LOC125526958 isoform X2 [Triticum urartu]XP_048547518.1 uncharacterized protein LOC125526958 isoform X2 [Triticum urartu]